MRLHLNDGPDKLFIDDRIFLEDKSVAVLNGSLEFFQKEIDAIIAFSKFIVENAHEKAGRPDFTGVVRPDLIHEISDDGEVEPVGVYEINGGSPECNLVAALLDKCIPGYNNFDPVSVLVEKIRETFGDSEEIAFVIGTSNCKVKRVWGDIFIKKLRDLSLNIVVKTEEEVMRERPEYVWRYGDARRNGVTHYSPEFTRWLLDERTRERCVIFNTPLEADRDFSNKIFLLESDNPDIAKFLGKNRKLLDGSDIRWSLENDRFRRLVMKPNQGASGDNITFGRNIINGCEWERIANRNMKNHQPYSLWEARFLPKMRAGNSHDVHVALDLNPTFWFHEGVLHPLYMICRIDYYEEYINRGTINVAQGAGVANFIPLH